MPDIGAYGIVLGAFLLGVLIVDIAEAVHRRRIRRRRDWWLR